MSIKRNLSTPEARQHWENVEKAAKEVETWPASKRAGINVSDRRSVGATTVDWQLAVIAAYYPPFIIEVCYRCLKNLRQCECHERGED